MPRARRTKTGAPAKPIPGIYTKPYIDSAVFIDWIKGFIDEEGVDRADIAEHILKLAALGHYHVCISSFTLAEVYKPKGYDPLKPEINTRILDYFEHEFIEMVIVDREIGIAANRIAAMYGLNPGDAVHAACAIRAGCDVLLTWDKPFLNKTVPEIPIKKPEKVGQGILNLKPAGETVAQPSQVERAQQVPRLQAPSPTLADTAKAPNGEAKGIPPAPSAPPSSPNK